MVKETSAKHQQTINKGPHIRKGQEMPQSKSKKTVSPSQSRTSLTRKNISQSPQKTNRRYEQRPQQKRPPKEKVLPLNSYVSHLNNVQGIVDDMFIKTDTGYFSVIKVHGIDIFHYKPSDQETVYYNYAHAETSCKLPHKYVFMDGFPVLKEQKDYVSYRLNNTSHPYRRFLLERQIERFEILEQYQRDRLAYLFVFGDNMDEIRKATDNFISEMKDTTSELCKGEELVQILSKILTFRKENSNHHMQGDFIQNILPNGLKLSGSDGNLMSYCHINTAFF